MARNVVTKRVVIKAFSLINICKVQNFFLMIALASVVLTYYMSFTYSM